MIESVFATGLPFGGRPELPEALRQIAKLLPMTAGVRRFGAAALDLAYVAAGRYEGYWEKRLNAWDVAAGVLLVREAGGFVEGLAPGDDPVESGGLVAGNGSIFETFAKIVREA